jgi:molybdopterin synthase sulfur carrier subunit
VTRVHLPYHLKNLARVEGEVEVHGSTLDEVLTALEAAYPALKGSIRDSSGKRRAFVRFFACEEDLSHEDPSSPLPAKVLEGSEPLLVVGAMAGG